MQTEPEPELTRTPTLARLLAGARAALVRQVLVYGIGTVLGATVLWLTFAFLADWGLRVPHAIRVLHGIGLAVVVTVYCWRDLLRPLQSLPGREGLALLFERAHPELRELLISAVQFQTRPAQAAGSEELVSAVVTAAEARAAALAPRAVVDPEAPRARLLLGLGGMVALAGLATLHPLHARTFLERLFGGTTPWPQRTNLVLELPGLDPGAIIERSPELVRLRLARGSDLAVLVTAEGETPDEVTLHFEEGQNLVLGPTGAKTFRTLLQSCQENLAFRVTGGDDEDGRPRVELEVLEPPDVAGLAIAVEPPAYSGLPPALHFDQDVEVLKGSSVRVHVLPSPREATGRVRFLPDDRTEPLMPSPFPRAPSAEPGDGEGTGEPGLSFACVADKGLGFRLELTDANGLSNPEPALFRIRVVEDRAPELAVLAPGRSEVEVVRGGAVPLRVRAEDDFALGEAGWRVLASEQASERGSKQGSEQGSAAPALQERPLALERFEPTETGSARRVRDAAIGSTRLEVDSLATGTEAVAVDSRFELEFFARDQSAPVPNEGRSTPIRLRVVTPEELLRRLQDRLAASRLDAMRLSEEQRTKRLRIEELLDALHGEEPLETGESHALSAALSGERRVLAEAQALARGLASATEDVLYARLDDKAAALLEFYHERASRSRDARFLSAPWRELARELAAGRLGAEGFAATLTKLVDLGLEIADEHAAGSVEELAAAEKAESRAAVAAALESAAEHAARVEKRVEELLSALAEWDNFQNVLTLARDILNRQKALRDRTQQFASEK